MSNLPNFPTIRPSLLLDFANSRSVDPRITFTRSSTATYYDAQGVLRTAASGMPRIDHDPVTGECKGLLVEEARTNLFTYSEQLDNAAWTKTGAAVTANSATAPDGAVTMDTLVEDTSTGVHLVSQQCTITAGSTLTVSAVVAPVPGSTRHVRIQVTSDAGANGFKGYFDLTNGTVASQSEAFGTGTAVTGSAAIKRLAGGSFLISFSGSVASASTYAIATIYLQSTPTGAASYTGDGTSGIYIWGRQIEVGAFPTSYIPTTTAAATRAADAASMVGTNFSEWFNPLEGMIYAEASSAGSDSADEILAICDGTNSNRIALRRDGANTRATALVITSGATVANLTGSVGQYLPNTAGKLAVAYAADNFAFSFNDAAVLTDTAGALPVGVNMLRIGAGGDGNIQLNGHIRRIAYYPKRLTNAELQALTA